MNKGGARRVKVRVESKQRRNRAPKVEREPRHRLLARAEALLKSGNADSAARMARQILENDPGHLSAWEILARSLWNQGCFDEVLTCVERAMILNPYEPGYHALKGSALQSLGRYGEATEAFQRASSLPGCEEALRELQAWQAGLVADLLRIDPVFRARYAQDPELACTSMGFRFVKTETQDAWQVTNSDRTWTYTRPS